MSKDMIKGIYGKEVEVDEYHDELHVDKFNLDEEVNRQLERFTRWAELHVEAQDRRDRAKNSFEETQARLDIEIRKDPAKFGLEKLTEGAIANTIILQDDYRKKQNEFLEAKRIEQRLSIAREAFIQRKPLLESLIKLYLSGYYGDPEVKEDSVRKELIRKRIEGN